MAKVTSESNNDAIQQEERGTEFLFWGWIAVAALNLGMVGASLALFAP
jgi:hypothetical protein